MGFDFRPTKDLERDGAKAYFADYAAQRRVFLAERGGFEIVEDEDGTQQLVEAAKPDRERHVTVLEPKRRITKEALGIAPKRVFTAAAQLGLEVQAWRILIDVDPVYYVSDSDEKSEKTYSAGDVRFEGYIGRRYVVDAAHMESRLGFQAYYLGKGAEGNTASFESARVHDPLGIDVENWVDYTVDKTRAKALNWTEEMRIQMGMAMNAQINDGSMRKEHVRHYFTGGDFTGWLDEYLALKGIKPLTPQRKPKVTAEERESALLDGTEWNG